MDKKLRNLRHNIKEELDNKVTIDKISLDHSLEEHREEVKSKRLKLAYILTPVLVVLLIALIIPIGIINNSNANGGEQVPSNPQTPGETEKPNFDEEAGKPGVDSTYYQESFITDCLITNNQEKLIIKTINEFETKFNNIINNDFSNSNKLSKYNEEFFNDNDLIYINVDDDYLSSNSLNKLTLNNNEVTITLNRKPNFTNNQKTGIILVTIPKEKHIDKISICIK